MLTLMAGIRPTLQIPAYFFSGMLAQENPFCRVHCQCTAEQGCFRDDDKLSHHLIPPDGDVSEEQIDYIDSIGRYDLLILDDLGVERNTSYAMEQMFQVVDRRYRSCKPLIVTTNLSLEQMKNAPDVEHSRIYGRILEYCAPILFSGKDMRKNNADTTKTTAREILSTKTTL